MTQTTESPGFPGLFSTLVRTFDNMPQIMLARMSTELIAHDPGGMTAEILQLIAENLDADSLVAFEAAFGPSLMSTAMQSAPTSVQSSYASAGTPSPMDQSYYWVQQGNSIPAITSWAGYDVYLQFYTSGAGDTPASALGKTNAYLNIRVSQKGGVEILIGVGVAVIIALFPDDFKAAGDWIKSQAQAAAEALQNYLTSLGNTAIIPSQFVPEFPGGGFPGGGSDIPPDSTVPGNPEASGGSDQGCVRLETGETIGNCP